MTATPGLDDVLGALGGAVPLRDEAVVQGLLDQASRAARHHVGSPGSPDAAARLAELVVGAVVRALSNPELSLTFSGSVFDERPGGFSPWTIAELAVLEQLRRGA